MLFTCTFILYMIRVNMSILIIAMVEPGKTSESKIFVPECARISNITNESIMISPVPDKFTSLPNYGPRYEWNKKLQGLILGSYFWGFTITGIPGGALAEKFGPSKIIMISFLVAGGLTLLGPLTASWHPMALIVSRFLIGLFGGVVYPCLHNLVAKWVPAQEKGKFMGALLGGAMGTVATWPYLGAVIERYGWNWGFFSNGIIVLLWTVAWVCLVRDTPSDHPWISQSEKQYIEDGLGGNVNNKKRLAPYGLIFRSVPFLALIVLHFGNLWGLFFLMTAGPNFMSSVLGFDLGHTGILAALPYLARLIFGFVFGSIGDQIRKKNWMTTTTTRKSFVLFSHILPGFLLLMQTFTGCDANWAIVLITLSLGLNGASTLTNLQNSQDLAPNFAATLYGIANCIGSTTGFISPLIVGYLTTKKNGLDEWHIIFYIGSSVYIACAFFFILFGTGDIQPWNFEETTTHKTGTENAAYITEDEETIDNENTKV
ncbi:sialin isoform X2 [Aethina tumida]|nr:sialin isoform X2 [Aethina tumida]